MNNRLTRINQTLIFFVLLCIVFIYGKPILVPLFFAIMLAMLMAPVCRWFDNKGLHRILSSLISVFILLIVFLSMLGIIVGQVSSFVSDLSQLEHRSNELLTVLQNYIERKFHVPVAEQTAFVKNEASDISQYVRGYLTGVLRSTVRLLIGLILTLVITFLFLLHKEKYNTFFLQFTPGETGEQKKELLSRIGKVSQSYLVGRSISIITLFVLYAIALLVIGIKNALLLAAVAALFNVIPYIGPVLAAVFPVLVALLTEPDVQPAVWVFISFILFQALDNYFVTPYFLGGEVRLSALSTIVIMICGGFIWGIAGMILFIPMLSIVKIIFDNIPRLEHYGYLIGDQGERPTKNISAWIKNIFK